MFGLTTCVVWDQREASSWINLRPSDVVSKWCSAFDTRNKITIIVKYTTCRQHISLSILLHTTSASLPYNPVGSPASSAATTTSRVLTLLGFGTKQAPSKASNAFLRPRSQFLRQDFQLKIASSSSSHDTRSKDTVHDTSAQAVWALHLIMIKKGASHKSGHVD